MTDLKNDTFYATIALVVDGKQIEVDSRPSDALALSVRVEAPIFVDDSVLDKAGILLDKDTGKPIFDETQKIDNQGKKLSDDELKKLSAFSEFIDTLDWDNFDKRKS